MNTTTIPLNQNKMETAVEWLEDEINKVLSHLPLERDGVKMLIQQAKAMEKEQIIDAASDHCYPTRESARFNAEEYYEETFKSE
jgi:hypothetical protein